jgi:hypothetical protein
MRVCPKCGYNDPIIWKNMPHQLYQEYTTFEDFEQEYPDLAPKLKLSPKLLLDSCNGYHLSKSGHVHRCPKYLCVNGKFYHGSSTLEKHRKPIPLNQRRLLVIER